MNPKTSNPELFRGDDGIVAAGTINGELVTRLTSSGKDLVMRREPTNGSIVSDVGELRPDPSMKKVVLFEDELGGVSSEFKCPVNTIYRFLYRDQNKYSMFCDSGSGRALYVDTKYLRTLYDSNDDEVLSTEAKYLWFWLKKDDDVDLQPIDIEQVVDIVFQ